MIYIKRILGVDLGEKRTGIALSDLTGTLAGGLELIETPDGGLNKLAQKITDKAKKYNIGEIVLGYPVNMNGTIGDKAKRAEVFRSKLESLNPDIKVILFDERLSTSLAHVYMNNTGIKGRNRKQKIDMLSAQIILQDYINQNKK
ncbi:MAG: Holliday junction resolvase RuvX [Oscillospiraceae bacterium]|nr:Holliday junction resolvase RuvX [Oscillospiraceae bacterium]